MSSSSNVRMRSIDRLSAFTLIEILVVIGIIAVLIALLIPMLAKARRHAIVLASPIAYIGTDGSTAPARPSPFPTSSGPPVRGRVYLTDPGGNSVSI